MQLTTPLLSLLLTLGSTPVSAAKWNSQLKLYDMGRIPSAIGTPSKPPTYMGSCGGISEGGYVCGSFGPGKIVAPRAIYRCVGSQLVISELCEEKAKYNRCVKNGRRKGKKFYYPFADAEKIVCAKRVDVERA